MDSILGQEPDLVTNIFVLLPVSDICQAELVCTSWRWFIVEHKIWKHKLLRKWHSNQFWKHCLKQHHWNKCELHDFSAISKTYGPRNCEMCSKILAAGWVRKCAKRNVYLSRGVYWCIILIISYYPPQHN